jgi:hypothetical protein
MNSERKLLYILIIGIVIFGIYWYWKKGSFSGFGFGALATSIEGTVASKPPSYVNGNFNNIMSAPTNPNTSAFPNSEKAIICSWPTTKVPIIGAGIPQTETDTIKWPPGLSLSDDNLKAFNSYMNQDAIICYMSDKELDISYGNWWNVAQGKFMGANSYNNSTWYNPKVGVAAPIGWQGPYIYQPYASIVAGIAAQSGLPTKNNLKNGGGAGASVQQNGSKADGVNYTAEQISRTNNIVTCIGNYTSLYEYICGKPSTDTEDGYGLANITVGSTNSNFDTLEKITFNSSGSFNDGAFYSDYDGTGKMTNINRKPTEFQLTGETKHAIWSVLLARQNQLIGRLNTTIVSEM